MKAIRTLRALARVELRQLWRHKGRSLLILLLVATPVAAIVCGSALVQMAEPTPSERATAAMGRADLRVDGVDTFEKLEAVRALLPAGARMERWFQGIETVRVPGRKLRGRLHALRPEALERQGLAAGVLRVGPGKAPMNAGEVALSPTLLQELGVCIGERVTLEYGTARTITGAVVNPEQLDEALILRTPAHVELRGSHSVLIGLPEATAELPANALRGADFVVSTRAEQRALRDALAATVVFALGFIAFFEAGLVIAAAFAVGLRRRRHEIGLLGSVGAPARGVVASILVSAATLALFGGVLGVVLGMGGAGLAYPYLDGFTQRLIGPFEAPWDAIMSAVALGLVVAALAAALPARRAAHVPIREALSGRRPITAQSGRWFLAGACMLASGIGLALLAPRDTALLGTLAIVGGPVLTIVGLGACSPWLLDRLARWAAPLPLVWRLAVRDAGRFRARNGPVVTAVLAGMSMSVAAAVVVASLETAIDLFPPQYRDDQLLIEGPGAEEVAHKLQAELDCIAAAPMTGVYAGGQPVRARFGDQAASLGRREWVACGGPALLLALGAEAAAAEFGAGEIVAMNSPRGVGSVTLTAWLSGHEIARAPTAHITLDQPVAGPLFVIHEAGLEGLGLESGPPLNESLVPWIVRLNSPVSREALERATAITAESRGATIDAAILHRRPARNAYYGVLLVCALTGLTVILVATSLTAAESVADARVLHVVGASPGLLRRLTAARAGYLAFLGCALAVPAGLVTASAIFSTVNFPLEYVTPWRDVLIAALGLPAIVFVLVWLSAYRAGAIAWRNPE